MSASPIENRPPEQPRKKLSASTLLRNSHLPLIICAIALFIQFSGEDASVWLRYDRSGILAGEVWRIVTGHLVHLSWPHLLMNVIGLLLIWLLFGHFIRPLSWLWVFLTCTIGISTGMLLLNPELEWYVGLSGILHGMFVAGAVISIKAGYRAEILLLLAFVAKLAWEQVIGPLPGSAEFAGGNVIVDAHLYGAISGLIVAGVLISLANNTGRSP